MANVLNIAYSVVCLGSKIKYSFSGHLDSLLGSFSPINRSFLAVFPRPIGASWQPIGRGKAAKMPGKAAKKLNIYTLL